MKSVRMMIAVVLVAALTLSGCVAYQKKYVGFRPPEAYPNGKVINGVAIGGEAYADKGTAQEAFGFDIRGAGLLPVQLVINNKSDDTIEINHTQTFLVDDDGRYWIVIRNNDAISRLEKSTELAEYVRGGAKGAFMGAAAGAILGAAIGIVSGNNVGSAIGKGAAIGAAGGGLIGGAKQGTSKEREYNIIDDLREKGLEGKPIPSDYLANGFIFFPGEAKGAREIRVQYIERESGVIRTAVLDLKAPAK